MTWNGRYKKTPRVKSKKFQKGTMPLQSASNCIDLVQLKFVRNMVLLIVVVSLHYSARTLDDM